MFAYETETSPIYIFRFVGRFTAADETAYLAALDDIVRRPPGFVLMVVLHNENRMSAEGNKAQSLWFKRHRDSIGALCRGMVRVRPDIEPDNYDDANFRKAMPFPTAVVKTEAEGLAWLRRQLEAAA